MSDKLRFGEMLVRAGLLSREDLERVLGDVGTQDVDMGELLVASGLVDESAMLQTLSKALNLPCVSLVDIQPDPRALQLVPRELCVEHHLLPVEIEKSRTGEHLHVAMSNPSDVKAIKRVTRQARLRIRPLIASAREIHMAIQRHYGGPAIPQPTAQQSASASLELTAPSTGVPDLGAAAGPAATTAMSVGGGGGDVFDFGVTDLSAYSEAPPEPPPPSFAPEAPAPALHTQESQPSYASDTGYLESAAPAMGLAQIEPAPDLSEIADFGSLGSGTPAPAAPAQLGSDLADLLDTSGSSGLMSTSDLSAVRDAIPPPAAPGGDGFGYVRRTRRTRSEKQEEQPAPPPPSQSAEERPRELTRQPPLPGRQTAAPAAKKPLPPLPPGLRGPALTPPPAGAVTTMQPQVIPDAIAETVQAPLDIGISGPSHTPPPSLAPMASPEPAGLVDDPDRGSLRGMLDRYVTGDEDEVGGSDDTLIAEAAAKYGGQVLASSTPPPAGDALGALARAAEADPQEAARLLVALVTHLSRRGIVDPAALLNELER